MDRIKGWNWDEQDKKGSTGMDKKKGQYWDGQDRKNGKGSIGMCMLERIGLGWIGQQGQYLDGQDIKCSIGMDRI